MKHIIYPFFLTLFLPLYPQQANNLTQAIASKYCAPLSADYVIVGVGTAGAVVAKMLSDDPGTSVVALHNGENLTDDPFFANSANAPIVVASALVDAPYYETGQSTPQANADDRTLLWVLSLPEGGASQINAGAYCRATNLINAQWEALAGPNWSVDRILNTYIQLEDYMGETTDPAARGFTGPLNVRQPPLSSVTAVSQKFTQAITDATGFSEVLDYNDPNTPIGPSLQLQYTQQPPDGTLRASSGTAFLNSSVMTPEGYGIDGRQLRVLFESTALRTLWSGNTAVGVQYLQNGVTKQILANKGVIVCAGLFSSAFLMHSGVGPQSVLQPLNIPVIYNNPNVGQGFADHNIIYMLFSTNPDDTPVPAVDPNNFLNQIAWLPDPTGDPSVRICSFVTTNPVPGFAVTLLTLSPTQSRGSITINSADPLQPPVIDNGILSNSNDLQQYQNLLMDTVNNINNALQLIDTDYQLILPSPSILSDPTLVQDFIRESVTSAQSFQSHCRMAPLNQGGVVDGTGHVYGVNNLIVADDSIVPQCIDGTPMATAYLIGANIANIIQGN